MPKKQVKHLIPLYPENQPMRIKYKDIFDLKAFYQFLREYFKENNWTDEEEGGSSEHWESYYGERIDQKGAREIWFLWRLKKVPNIGSAGGSNFINFYLDLDFHCLGITDAEIIKDGKKLKANKGEMEMKAWAYVHEAFLEKFEEHSFLKHFHLGHAVAHRLYHKDVMQRRKELYQELYTLQHFIKQWFKLKRHLPYEEVQQFYRSFAWPSHLKEE